ncbi:transcriptional regulator, TetR family [Lentzea fradiae]|uniref:Transcriptional regulator, TetR family n=1 Tax=Lentzea fradiae TaxID=200378 RepID=A0A1G7KLV0_9PSEU|nr:TetR/AcrR family transcriptional regulator [Lentzea fradiae]SDF38177.1 transcriptional regulator, TetR family [Lentzea fradiae]
MVRLTRAQQQARTRAAVLAAARDEFAEHGYAQAKVDRIAERAELTRGAVYSNFPGKRALYLAVLIDLVGRDAEPAAEAPPASVADALGVFARVWLERLPLTGESSGGGRLRLRSLDGVLDDGHVLAQVARLEAVLLAAALERGGRDRRVRLAELVLTLLDGAVHRAETAPGAGDPFDVAHACRHLAGIDLADTWAPPHLPYVTPARPCEDPWTAPEGLVDQLGGEVGLADGVVVVLGAGRLGAAEEAIRAASPGEQVVVVVVTSDPEETGRLVRLRVTDLVGCLRRVFPAEGGLRLVLDDERTVASALGLPDAGDETEEAVRVRDGVVVARARGRGAGHAVAVLRQEAKP